MLALHGLNVIGLDVSQTAVSAANTYAEMQLANPSTNNFADPDERPLVERGSVQSFAADFFNSGLLAQFQDDKNTFDGFDLIYDYTVRFFDLFRLK